MVQPVSEKETIDEHLQRVEKQYCHLISLQEKIQEVVFLYGSGRSGKSTLRHSLYQRQGVKTILVEFDSDLQVWSFELVGEIDEHIKQTGVYAMELPDFDGLKCVPIIQKLWIWFASQVAKRWKCSFIILIPSRIASEEEEIISFINEFVRLFQCSKEDTDNLMDFRNCVSVCLSKSQPSQTYETFQEQIQSIENQIQSPENESVKLILEQAKQRKKIYQFLNVPPQDNNARQIRIPLRVDNETFKLTSIYFSLLGEQLPSEQLDNFGSICQDIFKKLNEQVVELLDMSHKSINNMDPFNSREENGFLKLIYSVCIDLSALSLFSKPGEKNKFEMNYHRKFLLLAKFMEMLNLHQKLLEVFKAEDNGILSEKYNNLYNIQQKTKIFHDSQEQIIEKSAEAEKSLFLHKYKGKLIPIEDFYSLPPNWMKLDILLRELLQCWSVQPTLPYKRIKFLIFQAVQNLLVHLLPYEAISLLSAIPDFNFISEIVNDFFCNQISSPPKLDQHEVEVLEFMLQLCRNTLRFDLAETISNYLKMTSNLKISNIKPNGDLEVYQGKLERSKKEQKESNFCRRNKIFNEVFTRRESILQKCKQFEQKKSTAQEYLGREALYYFLYMSNL